MSKVGRTPIAIKEGITVTIDGQTVSASGAKGQITYAIPEGIIAKMEDGHIVLTMVDPNIVSKRAMYGLTRANLANAITGIDTGFEKKLELQGVGYRAQMQGNELVLSLGFSHPVKFTPQPGIKITVAESTITIAGTDKALVGLTAANIRSVRPPEPYKGKGIRYKGEQVRRKAGKAAKAVGGK